MLSSKRFCQSVPTTISFLFLDVKAFCENTDFFERRINNKKKTENKCVSIFLVVSGKCTTCLQSLFLEKEMNMEFHVEEKG